MKKFYLLTLFLAACSTSPDDPEPKNDAAVDTSSETDAGSDTTTDVAESTFDQVCRYTNVFSMGPECRSYEGPWSVEDATANCDDQSGTIEAGSCSTDELLANCVIEEQPSQTTTLYLYGDPAGCGFAKLGCDAFDGVFQPTAACEDTNPMPSGVFIPPELICVDPLAGEPAGASANGQVCTWQAISGATEEGRKFEDYASCDIVRTQRPYYPKGRPADAERDDPRLQDPTYMEELTWVKSQIEATACVCCHAASQTPMGASNFDIEQPGNFMNGFFDSGLALGANWVNSEALGAYPRDENNNFDRELAGIPSTDPDRMRIFFQAELNSRGLSEADFVDTPPFGGPLYDQIYYEPTACADGIGIDGAGVVTWNGSAARYLYVLEQGSRSPTVPPNLDTPDGTIWRIDVSPEDEPLESGEVTFGDATGATQRVPAQGAPVLGTGTTYYLYVSADVGIPVTRCEFVAP